MNQQRFRFADAYDKVNRCIYVFGGHHNSGKEGQGWKYDCEKYSVKDDEWTEISPLCKEKFSASTCIVDNRFVYVIGGQSGSEN